MIDFKKYFGPAIGEFTFTVPTGGKPFDNPLIKPGKEYVGRIFPILPLATETDCLKFANSKEEKSILLGDEILPIIPKEHHDQFPTAFTAYFDSRDEGVMSYIVATKGELISCIPWKTWKFETIVRLSGYILCFYEKE